MDASIRDGHVAHIGESGDRQRRAVQVWPRAAWVRQRRIDLWATSIAVVVYSISVLTLVATTGEVGIRCVFGRKVKELGGNVWRARPAGGAPVANAIWSATPPALGDEVEYLFDRPIRHYSDYIRAIRAVRNHHGRDVRVAWTDAEGRLLWGSVEVRVPPWSALFWSILWFVQELFIFVVGALVYWKRPKDESAFLFFWLCAVTVIAYMGGYHWSQVVVSEPLIFGFAASAVFVPIVSLHFYLLFPRINPLFARHRRGIRLAMYGVPSLTLAGMWSLMIWTRLDPSEVRVKVALEILKWLALGYVVFAVFVFLLCLVCLVFSFRTARNASERNQVRWILSATVLSVPPIAWLLWDAIGDPARLGQMRSAWPMFIVSLLYTVAYALSISRYKLMQAEAFLNRGATYVLVSVGAGLLYSAVLVLGALLIGDRLLGKQISIGTLVACVTAILLLILSGAARHKFQTAIDRRFHREKYTFDQAMRKMSQAVGSLVDRNTLGARLLDAASEVLRAEWGAIYLADEDGARYALAACLGPEPDERVLDSEDPLIAQLRDRPGHVLTCSVASRAGDASAAIDAMISLGGEIATPLHAHHKLVGLMVLGPKRNGLAYEADELVFLNALGSVATLALHSSETHQTLENLNDELREKVEKIAEQKRRILILQDQLSRRASRPVSDAAGDDAEPVEAEQSAFSSIKGESTPTRRMLEIARKVAHSRTAVLIRGESGTGKELLAEAIHAASPRASKPFVKVHCAALSQTLLESELFGHVKGAFTDAKTDRVGRFQQADGGTLFLDEVGDINLEVQTKLLRVLQQMSFERVGSSQTISVDVRILAATHQDLEGLIRQGRFREDLYYRLNVISVQTPPLRERRDDIFELAVHFLARHAQRMNKDVSHLDDDAVETLLNHDWPGNIRELENVIERAVVLADGPTLTIADLPAELARGNRRKRSRQPAFVGARGANELPRPSGETFASLDDEFLAYERQRLLSALDEAGGIKSEAARLLGMPRSTFFSRLRKHGLA